MHALRIVFCFVLVWAIMSMPPYVQAAVDSKAIDSKQSVKPHKWAVADRIVDAIYETTMKGNILKTHEYMKQLSVSLAVPGMFDDMTYEQMRAITDTVIRFKKELVAVHQDEQKLERAAARLRLVTDAVTHQADAMWLQYATVIMDDIQEMIKAKSDVKWRAAALLWSEHMDRILPAATFHRPPEVIEMANSMTQLVQKGLQGEVKYENVQRALKDYESVIIENLFGTNKELEMIAPVTEEPIPMRTVIWLGCIVTVTLAYVAYQKYRYDREGIHGSPWSSR